MQSTRVIAVILFLRAALKLPLALWFEAMRADLMDPARDATESLATFALASNLSQGLDVVLAISLTLAFAMSLGHFWSRVGAGAGAVVVLVAVAQAVLGEAIRSSYGVAVAFGLASACGWLVAQLAVSRATPALIALGAIAVTTALGYAMPPEASLPKWISGLVHTVGSVVVAYVAWRTPPAPASAASPAPDPVSASRLALLPLACRGIAVCIVLRVVVLATGVVLGATWLQTEGGAPYAVSVMRGGFLLGSLIDLAMFVYLVIYARVPRLWRGAWLETGLALYVLSWICGAVAAHQSLELATLLAEAKRATSIWSMPSLSEMERFQTVANWSLRAAMALGIGTGLTVAAAALASARALDDLPLAHRAEHLLWLVGGVGGIALVASVGLIVVHRVPTEAILVVAGCLLVAAAYALTTWLRVFLPLASRVESMHTR